MVNYILVGLGGRAYNTVTAINQSVGLATAHGAEVTGVSVIDEGRLRNAGPVPIGGGHYAHELAEVPMKTAQVRVGVPHSEDIS